MLFFTSDDYNLEKSPLSDFDKNAVFSQLYLAMKGFLKSWNLAEEYFCRMRVMVDSVRLRYTANRLASIKGRDFADQLDKLRKAIESVKCDQRMVVLVVKRSSNSRLL
jgi:hypothetical protein